MCLLELIAYISLTTPVMLAGVTLAGFPLVAHLLNRFARSRRVFPSLLLIRQSVAQQARWMRLRKWLLLVLRCLFVLAVAAAFARPVWRTRQGEAVAAATGNSVVLLVDASASMQAVQNGISAFDVAKVAAHRVLSDLRRGTDVANVVFLGAQPESVFDELSPNLPALQDELNRHRVTEQAADVVAAIRVAGQMLREVGGPHRLVIFSDLQASNWKPLLDAPSARLLPPKTEVSFVDLRTKTSQNVSIHAPRSDPDRPLVGQSVTLTAELENHTDQIRQVRVLAEYQDESLSPIEVSLEPRQRRDVAFTVEVAEPGLRRVVFRVDHDDLHVDDQCYGVLTGQRGIPVAILSDEDRAQVGSAAFYLSVALAPNRDVNDRFDVTHFRSRELSRATLDDFAAVFIGYLAPLEESTCVQLVDYLQRGGGCVFFCGQGNVYRNLLSLDKVLPAGCLPWVPGSRQDLYRNRTMRRIIDGQWRSKLLRDFDDTSQFALSKVEFGSVWRVGAVRPEANVLLRFDDGTPALAIRTVGAGQLVLANFSPDVDSSDLGKHGAFVALAQILAQNLRHDVNAGSRSFVGHPLRYPLAADSHTAESRLIDPSGQRIESSVSLGDDHNELYASFLDKAGVYTVRCPGEDDGLIPVNVEPSESDSRVVQAERVHASLVGPKSVANVVVAGSWRKPVDLAGRPLWGWMIVLAALLMASELLLLGCWRR